MGGAKGDGANFPERVDFSGTVEKISKVLLNFESNDSCKIFM